MLDSLVDYESSLPNKIICGNTRNISIMYSIINVYNGDNHNPLQKYWFILDNVKVVELGGNYIKIALSNSAKDRKFIDYINKLDNSIHKMICDIWKINFNKQVSYASGKYSPVILTLNDLSRCTTFGENNEMEYLDEGEYTDRSLSLLIELTDIMVGDSNYWVNYTVKQLKLNPTFKSDKSIFELIKGSDKIPDSVPDSTPNSALNGALNGVPNKVSDRESNFNSSKNLGIIDDELIPSAPPLEDNVSHSVPNRAPRVPRTIPHTICNNIKIDESEVPKFIVSMDDLKSQINKMRSKKLLKDEEFMRAQIESMQEEILKFKRNHNIVSDRYKSIAESIN
jgi:hypothetical protein